MTDQRLFPLEYYGIRTAKAAGMKYNPKCCAGEVSYGFGVKRQCKSKSGHGERGLFCEKHSHLKAKDK